jgi:hypothetical protein
MYVSTGQRGGSQSLATRESMRKAARCLSGIKLRPAAETPVESLALFDAQHVWPTTVCCQRSESRGMLESVSHKLAALPHRRAEIRLKGDSDHGARSAKPILSIAW